MRRYWVSVTVICFLIITGLLVAREKKGQAGTAGSAGQSSMGESLFKQHCSPVILMVATMSILRSLSTKKNARQTV